MFFFLPIYQIAYQILIYKFVNLEQQIRLSIIKIDGDKKREIEYLLIDW